MPDVRYARVGDLHVAYQVVGRRPTRRGAGVGHLLACRALLGRPEAGTALRASRTHRARHPVRPDRYRHVRSFGPPADARRPDRRLAGRPRCPGLRPRPRCSASPRAARPPCCSRQPIPSASRTSCSTRRSCGCCAPTTFPPAFPETSSNDTWTRASSVGASPRCSSRSRPMPTTNAWRSGHAWRAARRAPRPRATRCAPTSTSTSGPCSRRSPCRPWCSTRPTTR